MQGSHPAPRPGIVHLWLPEVANSKGGIQVFLQTFLEAYVGVRPRAGDTVFIKNDVAPFPSSTAAVGELTFRCFGRHAQGLRRHLAFAISLVWHAWRERPQLIIVGHSNFAGIAAWVRRLLGIPFWGIVYGIEVTHDMRTGAISGLLQAEKIFSISRFTRDHLIERWKLRPERFYLLPTTVDARRFCPGPKPPWLLEKLGLQPGQRVILTVCRLASEERYKGYDEILQALSTVRAAVPDVRYVLAGKGDDLERVQRLVEDLGVQQNVTLSGFVPDEELVDYYRLCDVFAMPSRKEGFGIVFLEALACGKPVLGGNQDGAVDALCDGELGILVNPDSVHEIAQSLISILTGINDHPLLYQPAELRRRVIAAYGLEKFAFTLRPHLESLTLKS